MALFYSVRDSENRWGRLSAAQESIACKNFIEMAAYPPPPNAQVYPPPAGAAVTFTASVVSPYPPPTSVPYPPPVGLSLFVSFFFFFFFRKGEKTQTFTTARDACPAAGWLKRCMNGDTFLLFFSSLLLIFTFFLCRCLLNCLSSQLFI